ncbi:hypothetical protein GGR92_005015 [Spirosoma lacussanchae]
MSTSVKRLKTKAVGTRMPVANPRPVKYPTTIDLTIIFTY